MQIVFGWNSFKIRSFSLKDFGIAQKEESGIRIEARQQYFHLFWIPFFSLGKKWAVRRGNKLYEMPIEVQMLVEASATAAAVRTPFYTYAGPLLIIFGFLFYKVNEKYSQYKFKQWEINSFNSKKAVLASKLQHLTSKDFISVLRVGNDGMDTTIYLKIEAIKNDEITVTPVKMTKPAQWVHAWEVEDEYTRHAKSIPSVKISYKQLQAACVKDYTSSFDRDTLKRLGINLLHDGRSYVTTAVVRHFGPIISTNTTGGYGGGQLTIDINNEGWPAMVSDITEQTGNGNWSENLNKEVPGRESSFYSSTFTLDAVDYKYGKPYKIIMTLKDTTGQLYKYEITGVNMDNTLKEL